MFQNVNGIGYNKDTSRGEELRQFMSDKEVDIMMLSELNVNWRLVSKRYSIYDMTRQWFENQSVSIAYNQLHRCKSPHLPGGTGVICQGEAALRKMENKADSFKLGRWSWTLFQGKNDIKLRVISVYVPCIAKTYGNKKVYCQQQKALQQLQDKANPITAFWRDFWKDVDTWLEAGEQLIIGGDWNIDVRKQQFLKKFEERNLYPAITSLHGDSGPETYNRGTKPIDEIFVSSTLNVTSAGYLAHGDGLGDHRPIWIEVTKDSALGAKLPDVPQFSGRRLKLRDPRTVQRYTRALEDYCNRYHLFERIDQLFKSISPFRPLTIQQQKEYEKLDQIRAQAMQRAESKCRKLYKGNVSWSPEIQQARDKIRYIRNAISHKRGTKLNKRTLIRDSKRANYSVENCSLEEMEKELDTAFTNYKALKQKHVKLRQSYLEELAQAMEDSGKGKKASHLRNLILLEEQRAMYRKLRRVTGKNDNLGTTFVTVTDENGESRDIIGKTAIEEAIMEENVKKYHQTEATCPFINDDALFEQFGYYGEGPASKLVFDGNYTPPIHTDEYTKSFLRMCQSPDIPAATFDRDCAAYKKSWEVIDERISSRELHYGHFKAACRNYSLINMHYQMAEIPFRTGYGPQRWKNATQVMILKKAGLNRIDKLRTIVLYEADFNHNNKWFGRQLMKHTKAHNLMAKEQYSVPGKKSIDHALNRRLIFDIARYTKTSIAMTSCDLKSCYDRISHTPAFLAMVGYRYLPTPIFSMFTCIQDMQWTTRTVYGDSEKTFGGWDSRFIFKPQGMGQGNGAGPPVWSTVSSRMFEVLHDKHLYSTFQSPISKQDNIDICGFAFVDDSDIIASIKGQNNPDDTVKKMQEAIDCWEGVAKTTGGALEPSKSWWYLIHFEWNDGEWQYGDLSKVLNDSLTALDKNNNRVELEYLPPDEAQTMLGVELAPDGNNNQQFKTLLAKTKKYAELARTGHLLHSEAWIALTSMALKSIEYGLPASTFTEKQLNQIMSPLLSVYLPRSGIQRNIKRDILYGPLALQGLGLDNPFLTQGIAQIIDVIDNTWKNTITGTFIKQCLEHLRLELGCNNDIFQTNIELFEPLLLTESWIVNVWKFISEYEIQWNDNTPKFDLKREKDSLLMESILDNNESLSEMDIKRANKCRIYLQVISLSDIVTGDGKRICSWALEGKKNYGRSRLEYAWPLWGQPSKTDWKAWRKALRRTFCIHRDKHLDDPLLTWTVPIPDNWEWYVNCFSDFLFRKKTDGSWITYKLVGRRTRFNRYRLTPSLGESLPPLEMMMPTTVQTLKHHYQMEGTAPVSPIVHPLQQPNDVATIKWLQYTIDVSPNPVDRLLSDIVHGTAIAVSDGSYDPSKCTGTAAWIIESEDRSVWIKGTSISPGPPEIQNPYRSEILGVLGILHHLHKLCLDHNLITGSITIACDGISALGQSTREDIDKMTCKRKQSDLLSACCRIINELPITIQPQHVKGHQDDIVPYSSLSRIEQMNVDMDFLAKATLSFFHANKDIDLSNIKPHPLSFRPPTCRNEPIFEDVKKMLYHKIAGRALHDHWIQKGRYNESDIQSIHWTSLQMAMKSSNLTRRRFITKWVSQNVACGSNMKRWQKRLHDYCPFCTTPKENTSHILHCLHADAIMNWEKHLLAYLESLYKLGFSTTLLLPLKFVLQQWKLDNTYSYDSTQVPYDLDDDVSNLLAMQSNLGWQQFLEGLIVKEWVHYVDQTKFPLQSTTKILSRMITKGWDLIFNVWEERNHRLHHTDHIFDLEGKKELLVSMEHEWRLGLSCLPASDYGYFFTKPLSFLRQQSLDWQKDWLATVKQGRELYRDHHMLHDDFSKQGPLRDWIGMTKVPLQLQMNER